MQYISEKISNLLSSGEPKPELRWGIIGCGKISHDFAKAMRKCENPNRVVAVAASSMDKALDFRKDLGLDAIAYGSYEELLADPQIDVVYIGVLNNTHSKWTLAALEAGKHVLCEKPMAGTAKEVRAMVDRAREKNLFFMEAFWSRFFPVYGELKKIIDSGKLGKPKIVHASLCSTLMDNRTEPELAECPLNDIGSYCVQFAMFCFGGERPSRAHIEGFKNKEGTVDLGGNITLEFPSGGQAYLIYTCVAHNTNGAFVSCDNGVAQIPEWFNSPTRLQIIEGKPMPDSNPKIEQFPLNDDAQYNFGPNSSGLRYETDHVYDCIMSGKTESGVMSLDESIAIAEVIDDLRTQLGVVFPHDYSPIGV